MASEYIAFLFLLVGTLSLLGIWVLITKQVNTAQTETKIIPWGAGPVSMVRAFKLHSKLFPKSLLRIGFVAVVVVGYCGYLYFARHR